MTPTDSIAAVLRPRGWPSVNLILVVVAVGLFAIVDAADQRIATNGGLGWVRITNECRRFCV